MSDYENSVGIQLETDFEIAYRAAQQLNAALAEMYSQVQAISKAADLSFNSLKKINGVNFGNLNSQIETMKNALSSVANLDVSGVLGKMDALKQFLDSFKNFDMSGIQQLKEIPKIMQSIAALDSSKIGETFSTLATQIQPFIAKLKEASSEIQALANATSAINKFNTNIGKAKGQVSKLGNEANKTESKFKKIFNIGNIMYFYNIAKRIFNVINTGISQAIDFRETENLFAVAMGDMKQEAMKLQYSLNETFGLAMADTMQYTATFKNMLSSIKGLTEDTTIKLSGIMTKMQIDFSSLYNVSIESAGQKLQSALSRQVRPIRSVSGMDITQNVLGTSLQQIGIYDRAVAQLSEMEKRLLIIYTLQQQMNNAGALGDFAKTIEQPAQQLRVLQQQIKEVGQWMGAVFEGTLGRVLPYINAFAMVIKELLKSFALLVGYKMPDSERGASILDQMDDTADDFGVSLGNGIDKATDKVKNLLAPFDKVNVLTKPDDSSSSGGSGSPSVGGIDSRILDAIQDYDMGLGNVKMKATEIRDRIMEWLGFTKVVDGLTGETVFRLKDGNTNLQKIKDSVVAIGIALGSWKIAKLLAKPLEGTLTLLFSITGKSTALVGVGTIIAGIAATLAAMGLRLYDLIQNSAEFRRGVVVAFDALKELFGFVGGVIGSIIGAFEELGAAIGLSSETSRGLLMDLGAVALLFTPAAPFAAAYLIFDAITLALKGLGYAASPVLETFDVLEGATEQTRQNLEPMLDTMNEMEIQLKTIDWNNIAPSTEQLDEAISTLQKFTSDLQTHLENSKKKAIDTLNDLFVESSFSASEQQQMLSQVDKTYNALSKEIKRREEEITAIYERAKAENRDLSSEEVKTITDNQEWLKEQCVKILSESEEEQNNILYNMKANADALSLEQASEIIKHSIETRNQTRAEAEARYDEQMAIAQKLREDGSAESIALADKIEAEADRQKRASIEDAEAMHKAVVNEFKEQNPEIARYLDEGTGEIRSKWSVLCEDVGTGLSNWWNNDIAPWFTIEKWQELGNNMKQGIVDKWDEFKDWWNNTALVKWFNESVRPWFTKDKWIEVGKGLKDGLIQLCKDAVNGGIGLFNRFIDWVNSKMKFSWGDTYLFGHKLFDGGNITLFTIPHIPYFRKGGFVPQNIGQLFVANEPGNPELVGNVGGQTAVVNNNMIIEAIKGAMKSAIIEGMQLVFSQQPNGDMYVDIYVDGVFTERRLIEENEKHMLMTGKPIFNR